MAFLLDIGCDITFWFKDKKINEETVERFSVCPALQNKPKWVFKPSRIFSAISPPLSGRSLTRWEMRLKMIWGRAWSPSSVSKSLCGPFWTHPTSKASLSSHFKDAGDRALHHGCGDHWRSGNREECPLISAVQRVRGFRVRPGVFPSLDLQGFQQVSGTPPFAASRMLHRGLTNQWGSLNSGGEFYFKSFKNVVYVSVNALAWLLSEFYFQFTF